MSRLLLLVLGFAAGYCFRKYAKKCTKCGYCHFTCKCNCCQAKPALTDASSCKDCAESKSSAD